MQALGFEDGLCFSLDRLCRRDHETQLRSCRRRGTPSSLPGYLDTWGVPAGPGGSLDRQAGVITRSRHAWDGETWWLAKTQRGARQPRKGAWECLDQLGPAGTSPTAYCVACSQASWARAGYPSLPLLFVSLPKPAHAGRVPATNLNCLANS